MLEYLARFVAGGFLVCLFALAAQVLQPKQFAGLFSAAPSVLVAGIAITLLAKGAASAALTAEGAIAGAVGMIVYCLLAVPAIQRFKALVGSLLSLSVWFLMAFGVFALLSIALRW